MGVTDWSGESARGVGAGPVEDGGPCVAGPLWVPLCARGFCVVCSREFFGRGDGQSCRLHGRRLGAFRSTNVVRSLSLVALDAVRRNTQAARRSQPLFAIPLPQAVKCILCRWETVFSPITITTTITITITPPGCVRARHVEESRISNRREGR